MTECEKRMFLKVSKPTTNILNISIVSFMENTEENPAEPVPDVAIIAESGQPSEPEETIPTEEASFTSENVASSQNDAAGVNEPLISIEGQSNVKPEVAGAGNVAANEMKVSEVAEVKKLVDNFAQTFIKFMKNLPDRRCVEIINMDVDYEDESVIFFYSSQDLLESFEEKQRKELDEEQMDIHAYTQLVREMLWLLLIFEEQF